MYLHFMFTHLFIYFRCINRVEKHQVSEVISRKFKIMVGQGCFKSVETHQNVKKRWKYVNTKIINCWKKIDALKTLANSLKTSFRRIDFSKLVDLQTQEAQLRPPKTSKMESSATSVDS